MVYELSQVLDRGVHLDFVLPFVLRPFLFELKLWALGVEEVVDEVNLNFIDVEDVDIVSTSWVMRDVSIDDAVVCGGHFQTSFDRLRRLRLQSDRNWLFNHFEISLRQQLKVDVWQSFLGSIDQHYLEDNVVVMNLNESLCVDRIREPSELVNFRINVLLDVSKEIIVALGVTA